MFLTTFDKNMYEETLREEGRDEVLEKYRKLAGGNEELKKKIEELSMTKNNIRRFV